MFNKYCGFFLICLIAVWHTNTEMLYTPTEGTRALNIFKTFELTQFLLNALYLRDRRSTVDPGRLVAKALANKSAEGARYDLHLCPSLEMELMNDEPS